jgi:hypothetical protein
MAGAAAPGLLQQQRRRAQGRWMRGRGAGAAGGSGGEAGGGWRQPSRPARVGGLWWHLARGPGYWGPAVLPASSCSSLILFLGSGGECLVAPWECFCCRAIALHVYMPKRI